MNALSIGRSTPYDDTRYNWIEIFHIKTIFVAYPGQHAWAGIIFTVYVSTAFLIAWTLRVKFTSEEILYTARSIQSSLLRTGTCVRLKRVKVFTSEQNGWNSPHLLCNVVPATCPATCTVYTKKDQSITEPELSPHSDWKKNSDKIYRYRTKNIRYVGPKFQYRNTSNTIDSLFYILISLHKWIHVPKINHISIFAFPSR